MTAQWLTVINSFLIFATAAIGVVALYRGKKRDEQILKLTVDVDGRLTQLLELTAKSSHAEGMKDEKANSV